MGEGICKWLSDNGLISKLYEEVIQLNNLYIYMKPDYSYICVCTYKQSDCLYIDFVYIYKQPD